MTHDLDGSDGIHVSVHDVPKSLARLTGGIVNRLHGLNMALPFPLRQRIPMLHITCHGKR